MKAGAFSLVNHTHAPELLDNAVVRDGLRNHLGGVAIGGNGRPSGGKDQCGKRRILGLFVNSIRSDFQTVAAHDERLLEFMGYGWPSSECSTARVCSHPDWGRSYTSPSRCTSKQHAECSALSRDPDRVQADRVLESGVD